jgi:hypothetical protein
MPVSPVRDIVSILAGLVLILLVPLVLSMSVFHVTAIPINESFQLPIVSGNLGHSYFVSLLGMSQPYGSLSTQLVGTDLLSYMFRAIASDWAALSVALFLVTGIIAAWALGSDLERIAIPVAIGLVALAMGVLFIRSFVPGITGLGGLTTTVLANALIMLVVVSYGVGTLLSGLMSFGLGRLLRREAEEYGGAQGPVGPVAVGKAAEAEATKAATVKEEPTSVAEKETLTSKAEAVTEQVKEESIIVVPNSRISELKAEEVTESVPAEMTPIATGTEQVKEESMLKAEEVTESVPAEMTPIATGTEQVKAPSAPEAAEAGGIEEIMRQARESRVQPPAPQQNVPETEQVSPSVRLSTGAPLPERLEPTRESRDIFTALEEPMQRISSRVEREPGAVWRPIPCPICGSELTWSREKQAYYCPFCGTVP